MTLIFRLNICRTCGTMDNASDYRSEVRGSTPGRFVLLRMRQSGVENNKSEVRGDFPSN